VKLSRTDSSSSLGGTVEAVPGKLDSGALEVDDISDIRIQAVEKYCINRLTSFDIRSSCQLQGTGPQITQVLIIRFLEILPNHSPDFIRSIHPERIPETKR